MVCFIANAGSKGIVFPPQRTEVIGEEGDAEAGGPKKTWYWYCWWKEYVENTTWDG